MDYKALQVRPTSFSFWLILLFLVFIFLFHSTQAKVGYDIHVVVNNSTMSSEWSRSQSTDILSFKAEGVCNGDGKFSKYVDIDGFAGQSLKETGYSNPGRLISKSAIQVKSDEDWLYIVESGKNDSELYTVEINESLPTFVYSEEDLYYSGEGIRTRSVYVNNEDEIYTRYYATRLLKSHRYGGIYSNSLITAEVTPSRAEELVLTNYTTAFRISSQSDRYSGLGYVSEGELIEQRYVGSFTINQVISSKRMFNLDDEEGDWLGCCPSKPDIYEAWSADLNCSLQEYKTWSPDMIFLSTGT